MYCPRILDLKSRLSKKSAFLIGPRSVGKTSLYEKALNPHRVYDLLDRKVLKRLIDNPSLIFDETMAQNELIVIDEIQKLPLLLDEVQRTIDKKKARFLLTGSSARKLKKQNSNLLGGRASSLELLPLSYIEIPKFNLEKYLNAGGIPRHYFCESNLADELEDYAALYLREEIQREAITRNLEGFSRFLDIMALHSGDEMVIENFSNDCGIKVGTFRNYLEVLKDTLIGFEVFPFLATTKRKAITRSKYFLFDVGVANHLAGRESIKPKSELWGRCLEHFIAMELRAYNIYKKTNLPLQYWRSTSQMEVDFVIGRELAVEVKATANLQDRMLKGLMALDEEKKIKHLVAISFDSSPRRQGSIDILPWDLFLKKLWDGEFY